MKHSAQFVKHFELDERYVTTIWLRTDTGNYTSVVSDLKHPNGFDGIDEIELYLTINDEEGIV